MTDQAAKCEVCKVEFEPKTPILYKHWDIEHRLVDAKPQFATYLFHYGCWDKRERANVPLWAREPHPSQINADGTVTFKVSHG